MNSFLLCFCCITSSFGCIYLYSEGKDYRARRLIPQILEVKKSIESEALRNELRQQGVNLSWLNLNILMRELIDEVHYSNIRRERVLSPDSDTDREIWLTLYSLKDI